MKRNLKSISFVGVLAVLLMLLAACSSTEPGNRAGMHQPEIQLYFVADDQPVRITSGALVGSMPVLELRIVDRDVIESVRYRVDGGSWRQIRGYGFHRARFTPSVPFSGTSASLEIEAVNRSGHSSSYAAELLVDSIQPVISLLEVEEVVYTDSEEEERRRVEVLAQAVDEGAGSGRIEMILELNGEVVHSTTGGMFDYAVSASELPEGIHRYQLSAVDGAGNRSESRVIPVRGGIY